jgi:hypothetical protein
MGLSCTLATGLHLTAEPVGLCVPARGGNCSSGAVVHKRLVGTAGLVP